ncbi:FeoB-associated Cys-rich membrane protein [Telluribacter humicola]|uniref:FeoB-associated Cys-rich membrane protein n=1 Tax=Telluribacter humicola TaxID=1720261 RepID=UPI001A9640FB|nr:FeoB-associated Cys-rich membrane protein [Telluribacter humicola]
MTQQIIVILIFVVALGYLGWRTWKSLDRRNSSGCGKGCGCEVDKVTISPRR